MAWLCGRSSWHPLASPYREAGAVMQRPAFAHTSASPGLADSLPTRLPQPFVRCQRARRAWGTFRRRERSAADCRAAGVLGRQIHAGSARCRRAVVCAAPAQVRRRHKAYLDLACFGACKPDSVLPPQAPDRLQTPEGLVHAKAELLQLITACVKHKGIFGTKVRRAGPRCHARRTGGSLVPPLLRTTAASQRRLGRAPAVEPGAQGCRARAAAAARKPGRSECAELRPRRQIGRGCCSWSSSWRPIARCRSPRAAWTCWRAAGACSSAPSP